MSLDNASSVVTYTSISSDLNGLSWGIPLVNVRELLEMDTYEEVAQQGKAHPLLPAYVPDPMKLDEHIKYAKSRKNNRKSFCHMVLGTFVWVYDFNAAKKVEFHRKLGSFVSFREMITSQLQGKLWLYDEVRAQCSHLLSLSMCLIEDEDFVKRLRSTYILVLVEDQPYADDASPTAESPGYIADSNSMNEGTDEDSIDYPDEPEDGEEDDDEDPKEDPEEDPSDEHEPEDDDEDPEEDPNEEHEPEDEDTKEEEPFEGSDETEPFKEDETAVTPSPPRPRRARIPVRSQTPIAASTLALIDAFAAGSPPFALPPTSPAYDQAPLVYRTAMIRMRVDILEEDMPPHRRFVLIAPSPGCDVESFAAAARAPRGQYDFVDTVEAGQGLIRSPGHDVRTIAKAADKAEDVGYVRALQASKHRMMTSIEEVNLRVSYQAQRAEGDAVRQMMRTHVLETRAQIDTVEDTGSSYYRIMPVTRQGANAAMTLESIQGMIDQAIQRNSTHTQDDASHNSGEGLKIPVQPARLEKMESIFHISSCAIDNQVKFATCTLLGAALTWWNGHVRTLGHDAAYTMTWGTLKKKLTDKYCPKDEIKKLEIELWNLRVRGNDVGAYTQHFQELALMCTKFLADETEKVDKYISGLPDNIHGNVMSARPKTLDDAIELANDLMDQKLRTYAERQNNNKRKADDSLRTNQQLYKKQNVARTYTVGPSKKKYYTRNLPLCTKCNYHHIGQCAPKCRNCKRYGHATNDCRVNTNNNNNKNQKAGACYECGNTGHIKKNCPKLKNCGNGNGNGTTQGRAYAFGRKRC
ncbi:putative reverse transcriptase domain-containing protein [Tanacetum coccineum]|uniref:Reverse transcriptase domain-containing protein n=1 Tax=Tanacetum coccineum TaxID=301880 RepID=A0ABQ5D7I3_9ASTR